MEKRSRRSRWNDEGTTAVILRPRDFEILSLLSRYRYLRVDFIHAFLGGNLAALQRRLNILTRKPNKHLHRPVAQRQAVNANYRYQIYELGERGEKLLNERGLRNGDERIGDERQFAHAMMINDALSSLELGVKSYGRFIPFREIKSHPKYVGPRGIKVSVSHLYERTGQTLHTSFEYFNDAIFGVEHNGFRFFQLEAEHSNRVRSNNLHQTSFLKKFIAIREITERRLFQTQWGLPNLLTLVVTPNRQRIETMKRLILEETNGKGVSYVLFTEIPALEGFGPIKPMPELATTPWQRAGYPDLSIN